MLKKINIAGKSISIISNDREDYISLSDMAKSQFQDVVIIKWMSLKSTIEYLGEWEALYNTDFNSTEFGRIKNEAGSNNFVLSVKQWIKNTKAGRYGETYAHRDIAFILGCRLVQSFNCYW